MSKMTVGWNHIETNGNTCEACAATKANLDAEIERANRIFQHQMLSFELEETIIKDPLDGNPNVVQIKDQVIGAMEYDAENDVCICAEITAEEIRTAIYKAVGVEEPNEIDLCGCGDSCDDGSCGCSGCSEGCC